jgi:hypothetical protein
LLAHATQAASARAARQTEQHSFGLIIEGVAEQNRTRPQPSGGFIKGRIPGVSGGGLETGRRIAVNRNRNYFDGAQTELAQDIGGAFGNQNRFGLQAVFDDYRANSKLAANAGTSGLKSRCRGQRERVGTARTGNQHQVFGVQRGGIHRVSDGATNVGYGRG